MLVVLHTNANEIAPHSDVISRLLAGLASQGGDRVALDPVRVSPPREADASEAIKKKIASTRLRLAEMQQQIDSLKDVAKDIEASLDEFVPTTELVDSWRDS